MSYSKETIELAECMKVIFSEGVKNAEEVLRGEVPVLCHIRDREQITPTELAHTFSLSTARIATILNRLENKNFIVRVHDNRDRRKVYIHLTDEGRQRAEQKAKELYDRMQGLLQLIGDKDAAEFVRLTKKVAAYMKQK